MQRIDASLAQTKAAIATDVQKVAVDRRNLRKVAIDAYMSDGTDSGLESMFSSSGETAVVTDEYRSVASGNISGAVDQLNTAETSLAAQQSHLQTSQAQATAALAQVASSRQAAMATVADQEHTLAQVNGQIAMLVAQQQAAEQAQQAAAFQKRVPPRPRRDLGARAQCPGHPARRARLGRGGGRRGRRPEPARRALPLGR